MSEVTLPCGPEAAGQARRIVDDACGRAELSEDGRDSALLCTSELVTNAIVHGRSEVRLTVTTSAGRVRIEVGDDNSRHPTLQPADDGALDGRGLFIVDLLATRWGVRDDAIGKVVWFELSAARQEPRQ
ncbi:ATP-binding protein [Quadrisphaera sp. DSM 44207]|uniref:ATP-binding protein n=1 Tax=Quadrisphaera sp. DSM 44207 TaxID=1881057 RepID=UPI00088CA74F|nr:ATP-binding protein [Quadrisphaera sp. DSM 44207]SDQ52090.1 Anti-sigma regulatory factor (Ser/Thr protein kinase) [Quadrisphaera sp. DSM 44207]